MEEETVAATGLQGQVHRIRRLHIGLLWSLHRQLPSSLLDWN